MNGGTISGNEAGFGGGGVYVAGGTFTMSGGTISGNIANMFGGGVFVNSGTFQMAGGTIIGTGDAQPNSSGSSGAALYNNGTAEYGIMNGTWKKNGNLSSTSNTINIVNGVLTAATAGQWAGALDQIKNGGSGTATSNYYHVINIGGDGFAVDGTYNKTFGTVANINVTINGNGKIISLKSNTYGTLLYIFNDQTVTIENLNLRGKGLGSNDNDSALVYIDGGTLTMKGGTISGNKGEDGGGVNVLSGTFTMSDDAQIHGNNAKNGGGVYVTGSGTFNMKGGTISGNTTTTNSGGGVYVIGSGTFNMNDGTISGNTTANSGGGVYVGNNSTFTKTGGTIWGYDTSEPNNSNSNVVKDSNNAVKLDSGHAVYLDGTYKYRDSTAGPNDYLDSSKTGPNDGWDN
jgi:hypothetical protein